MARGICLDFWSGLRSKPHRLSFFAFVLALILAIVITPLAAQAEELAEVPAVPGPKRTIAVGPIEAAGGFELGENWDVGNGLASMLTSALLESDRFHVAERTNLRSVLNEKELQTSKVAGGNSAAGKMTAAQFVVVGSVTEFGSPSKGGGVSVGSSFGGIFGGLGASKKTGKVTLDLRLVDVRSGDVIDSFIVTEKVSKTGLSLKSGYKGVVLGGEQFAKTPLGQATRGALHQAVAKIAESIAALGWEGRIVTFGNGTAIINAGGEAGVHVGDRLRVERLAQVLTDPETGRVLTEGRYYIGDLLVTAVEPEVAFCSFTSSNGSAEPVRGDIVIALEPGTT